MVQATNTAKGFKILTPKEMVQRLPVPLAQEKAKNTYEKLPKESVQVINKS